MIARLGIPVVFIAMAVAILIRLELADDPLAQAQHRSVPEYTEAQVRLYAEIATNCVAEFAYTHPGTPTDFQWLLSHEGPCDPFNNHPLKEK